MQNIFRFLIVTVGFSLIACNGGNEGLNASVDSLMKQPDHTNSIDFTKKSFYYKNLKYGAREVDSTPIERGTMFASPDGKGDGCTKEIPCSITTAFSKVKAGDVLFLKGGVYDIKSALTPKNSGIEGSPIIIESYPGEIAILDGGVKSAKDISSNPNAQLKLRYNDYIRIRKVEVRYMPKEGIAVYFGNHNIVEGCNTHHNILSGIAVNGGEWHEDRVNYTIPYKYGENIIRDNISHHNSDIGTKANGGNADGIWIGSGRKNRVVHNTVFANSDDGIDTWRSNYTDVEYNFAYDNGKADGDGNGIKTGGNLNPKAGNGKGAVAIYNLAYKNRANGFDYNAGRGVKFEENISYKNGNLGFRVGDDTLVQANISLENRADVTANRGHQTDNSWQIKRLPKFKSLDPSSEEFMVVEVAK
jgi:parallel beta-helix repeat protein